MRRVSAILLFDMIHVILDKTIKKKDAKKRLLTMPLNLTAHPRVRRFLSVFSAFLFGRLFFGIG